MNGSMQSTITPTILGFAVQIEREFISTRSKEALPKALSWVISQGQGAMLKLDNEREQITNYLKKGVSKPSIARSIGCPCDPLCLAETTKC
jgi:hypothetical protein